MLPDNVIFTGGNSGIGLSVAKLFAEQGARVFITCRNQTSLNIAVDTMGYGAIGIVSDVLNLNSIKNAYEKVSEKLGKIDVLVVNAGVYLAGPMTDYTGT